VVAVGTNNRARRAAKVKARAANRSQDPHRTTGARFSARPGAADTTPAELVTQLLLAACQARWRGDDPLVERAELELCRHPVELVRAVLAGELRRAVALAWANGWQPAELVRQVRRTASADAVELARAAIAADHADRADATLDPRWADQVAALALPPIDAPGPDDWVEAWATRLGLGRYAEAEVSVQALQSVRWIPALEELIPPPGGPTGRATASAHRAPPSDVDRAVLDKIRALLSKAESTTFEAEAEAFTAKAHELMTRHAIEAAMLAGTGGRAGGGDAPSAMRIAIDDPYRDAKSQLLHVVAQAGRCRSVFFSDLSLASVVGFGADLLAVELLYTSLLVQAQTSLTNAARALPAGARQRTRSFRSSFLLAYAVRIGERLQATEAEVVADAASVAGPALLPALRTRGLAVDEAVEQRYGQLTSRRIRGGLDAAGWHSGREAADAATLVTRSLPGAG
jgi:hypothetical protein